MKSFVTRLTAVGVGVALSALICSVPAAAAPLYYTAFHTRADFTDTPRTLDQALCDGVRTLLVGHFAATENRPRPGCVVQIYTNASPGWATLCTGRAELPRLSRYNPEVRAVPGASRPCLP